MNHPLRALGRSALAGLAEALASGRLVAPITRTALAPHVPAEHLGPVCAALAALESDGMAPRHIARSLQLLVRRLAVKEPAARLARTRFLSMIDARVSLWPGHLQRRSLFSLLWHRTFQGPGPSPGGPLAVAHRSL